MTNHSEKERYFDFSEEGEVAQGFDAGSYSEDWKKILAKEVQTALSRQNPIVGLKQLLAFSTVTQAFQSHSIASLLSSIRMILIINIVLMLFVIYLLAIK